MAIMSYVHEVQTIYNVVQNPQMVLLSEKERMVSVRGVTVKRSACCCVKEATAVHSKFICFSLPIAPLLQATQTLLALPTWLAKQPVAIGKP